MGYLIWKLIHVVSVILFLGNITMGLFWAAQAHKTGSIALVAATFEGIIKSDRWFTIPGVIGILVSGVVAAIKGHLPILGTGWILWSIVLFSISGIVFGSWVVPLQRKIVDLAQQVDAGAEAWNAYVKIYKRWELWGLVALLTPASALVLMVLKPALPGL